MSLRTTKSPIPNCGGQPTHTGDIWTKMKGKQS